MKITGIEVTYLDHLGTDLDVINAAKVSNQAESQWLDAEKKILAPKDVNLIEYLARGIPNKEWEETINQIRDLSVANDIEQLRIVIWKLKNIATHFSPFTHCYVKFRFKVPIFLARQLTKHQVGATINEVSRRYVDSEPEYFFPQLRKRGVNVKQGSSNEIVDAESIWLDIEENVFNQTPYGTSLALADVVNDVSYKSNELYKLLLRKNVAPEIARTFISQNMMTEFIWTGSLYFWSRLYNQRSDSHAQKEHQMIVTPLDETMKKLFPHSWYALTVPH